MKKETVQKSHEMYKKKIEEKKLADEMITHDIHLTPMIFDADSSFYYTYFKINSLKDWELLKKVYDIHPLKMQVTNFPEIIIAESWFDLEDADICKDEEVFKKFELNLDEMRWEKISVMQQSTIDYWESLGYKINLEKKEEAVSNQNITYATLRVVHFCLFTMNIQNISKNDREVTVTLSSDELVKLCNVLYYARDKYDGDNLYHEIKSDLMIARDISQYGNIDDTTLSKIIKERAKAANPYQTKPSQEF